MTAELALLRSHVAVCGASTDVPSVLSAAWEAFDYLSAAASRLTTGPGPR
jgi:hypothetical protein